MDVRGKDCGKDKHSQVCLRFPMESIWTDNRGLGQSAENRSCSKESEDWGGGGGQGDAGPHQLPSGASEQVDQDFSLVGS